MAILIFYSSLYYEQIKNNNKKIKAQGSYVFDFPKDLE